MAQELPTQLLRFIRDCLPTYQAAEVLLLLVANADREFRAEEIVTAMRPVVITLGAVNEYVSLLAASGVLAERSGGYVYAPATRKIENAVADLRQAYNERPVTLIGAIHKISDSKIQSFSDSFKWRED